MFPFFDPSMMALNAAGQVPLPPTPTPTPPPSSIGGMAASMPNMTGPGPAAPMPPPSQPFEPTPDAIGGNMGHSGGLGMGSFQGANQQSDYQTQKALKGLQKAMGQMQQGAKPPPPPKVSSPQRRQPQSPANAMGMMNTQSSLSDLTGGAMPPWMDPNNKLFG